jgi:cytochrome P450
MHATGSDGKLPLYDAANDAWMVQDADHVERTLLDPAVRVRPVAEPVPPAIAGTAAGRIFSGMARWNDGEAHATRRRTAGALIAKFDFESVSKSARHVSAALVASATDIQQWMVSVSPHTLGLAVGLEESSLPDLAADVGAFARSTSPGADQAQVAAGIDAADRLWERLSPIGSSELEVANLIGLFFQGYDSVAGLLGSALLFMRAHPEVTDPYTVVRRVVHESPPIRNTRRFVSRETRIGGVTMSAGSAVIVDLEVATAAGGPSLAFGAGAHQCPGQLLAFTIAPAALAAGPRLADLPAGDLQWLPYPNTRIPDLTGIAIERTPS